MYRAWMACCVVGFLFLTGCATDDIDPEVFEKSRHSPEVEKSRSEGDTRAAGPRSMVGSTREALIKKYGQPGAILDVTLLGRAPSEGYVYAGENCSDTFVVVIKTGDVVDYFCR